MSADEYLVLIHAERARLEHVRTLESDNAALKNANEALHRKLDSLESRPAVKWALAASNVLGRAPRLKAAIKAVMRR